MPNVHPLARRDYLIGLLVLLAASVAFFLPGNIRPSAGHPATSSRDARERALLGEPGDPLAPLKVHSSLLPWPEAVNPSESVPRGMDLRLCRLALPAVAKDRTIKSPWPDGLSTFGTSPFACVQPSLQILFCSWQA
jgi:hypothetical protein